LLLHSNNGQAKEPQRYATLSCLRDVKIPGHSGYLQDI